MGKTYCSKLCGKLRSAFLAWQNYHLSLYFKPSLQSAWISFLLGIMLPLQCCVNHVLENPFKGYWLTASSTFTQKARFMRLPWSCQNVVKLTTIQLSRLARMGPIIKGYLPILPRAKYLTIVKWYRSDWQNSFPCGQITPNSVTHPCNMTMSGSTPFWQLWQPYGLCFQ